MGRWRVAIREEREKSGERVNGYERGHVQWEKVEVVFYFCLILWSLDTIGKL
jgi:hypothetical protein